jgi:hypothetical protein
MLAWSSLSAKRSPAKAPPRAGGLDVDRGAQEHEPRMSGWPHGNLTHATIAASLVLALSSGGCSGKRTDGPDAAIDAPPVVDAPAGEQPKLLTVDFSVMGCPTLDPAKPQCSGPAPLTVSFVPITSDGVTRLLWLFGDLSQSTERAPTHTYNLPGTYDVTLIGTPGLADQTRAAFVVVTPNRLGDPCDVDSQCATGLGCVCGSSAKCPGAFARGLCSRACATGDCPEDAVCADLTAGGAMGEPWRGPLCLHRCARDAECPAGHSCRQLPGATGGPAWAGACFPALLGDVGDPCRAGNGELQNGLCAGGACQDLGALGLCSLDCATRPCPDGTRCAAFNDGRQLCLRACGADAPCREDPLLACAAPGRAGPLGFKVMDAPAGATFCAPRACDVDAQCAPAGVCAGDPTAGHCRRRAADGGP